MKQQLLDFILNHSTSTDKESALKEWEVIQHPIKGDCVNELIGYWYKSHEGANCKCGRPIKYVFQIKNMKNGFVFPNQQDGIGIGSICINEFFGIVIKKQGKKKHCHICDSTLSDGICKPCMIRNLKGVVYCKTPRCHYKIKKRKLCRKCLKNI